MLLETYPVTACHEHCDRADYFLWSVELTVTISPGEDTPFSPITLQTNDTQGLRHLLDECKRLKELSSMFLARQLSNLLKFLLQVQQ